MDYAQSAQVFKAYADENRLRILSMLSEGEKCACVLLEELDISQPTLSHHMKLLDDAQIVNSRKEGKWTYYSLASEGPTFINNVLDELEPSPAPCCCSSKGQTIDAEKKELLQQVQDRYRNAAQRVANGETSTQSSCCGNKQEAIRSFAASDNLGAKLYTQESAPEIADLPEDALLASLGCGNPTAVAELKEGETVLDLGSGGGIDVLLSAARVGESGFVYGLDMTDEMLELAQKNAREAHTENVDFLKGHIEDIPLDDNTVDVVISNCVINLSVDKNAVFSEVARVLKPGGRMGVSDVVANNELTPADRQAKGDYTGCIAGALSFEEYEQGLLQAGLTNISITPTHEVVDGMHASIIKAQMPQS